MGDEVKALEAELRFCTREFARVVLNVAEITRLDSTGIACWCGTQPTCTKPVETFDWPRRHRSSLTC